jgi:hypothetical protein
MPLRLILFGRNTIALHLIRAKAPLSTPTTRPARR